MSYEIGLYKDELLPQVIDLVKYFSGGDYQKAAVHFHWKYLENPSRGNAPGIVALSRGKVVGFRGFLPFKWKIAGKDGLFTVLSTGDNIVHRQHRRMGISTAMRNLSLTAYETEHRLFMSLSSGARSVHIHKKFGAVELAPKTYLNGYGLLGLTRFAFNAMQKRPAKANQSFGQFGDVLVSNRATPAEMASIAASRTSRRACMTMVQDEAFFQWRFNNPRYNYIFYYQRRDDTIVGYLVIRLSNISKRGYIFDYGVNADGSYHKLLRCVLQSPPFDVLSIWNISVPDDFRAALQYFGFKRYGLLRIVEKHVKNELPILVRPTGKRPAEADWYIGGLDTRRITSWHIKQVCSDAL